MVARLLVALAVVITTKPEQELVEQQIRATKVEMALHRFMLAVEEVVLVLLEETQRQLHRAMAVLVLLF